MNAEQCLREIAARVARFRFRGVEELLEFHDELRGVALHCANQISEAARRERDTFVPVKSAERIGSTRVISSHSVRQHGSAQTTEVHRRATWHGRGRKTYVSRET
jgi:hypothetical protein